MIPAMVLALIQIWGYIWPPQKFERIYSKWPEVEFFLNLHLFLPKCIVIISWQRFWIKKCCFRWFFKMLGAQTVVWRAERGVRVNQHWIYRSRPAPWALHVRQYCHHGQDHGFLLHTYNKRMSKEWTLKGKPAHWRQRCSTATASKWSSPSLILAALSTRTSHPGAPPSMGSTVYRGCPGQVLEELAAEEAGDDF